MSVILVLISLWLPFYFVKYTTRLYASLLMLFTLLCQIISFINAYCYTFSALNSDAQKFYQQSVTGLSFNTSGSTIYPFVLHKLYIFDSSMLIGQTLSIIAYEFAALVLYQLIKQLKFEKYALPILILFSINPMEMIIRAGILRESFQQLLFMLFLYYGLIFLKEKTRLRHLILLLIFGLFASSLHFGIAVAVFFTAVYLLFNKIFSFHLRFDRPLRNLTYLMMALLGYMMFMILKTHLLSFFTFATHYALHIAAANTQYTNTVSSGTVTSFIQAFFNYMFYPYPWNISSAVSFYAGVISFSRFILLYYSIKEIKKMHDENIQLAKLKMIILVSVLAVAFVFSIGTNNYGTSMRHQMLTYWGLVLLGVPGFFHATRRKKSKCKKYALSSPMTTI